MKIISNLGKQIINPRTFGALCLASAFLVSTTAGCDVESRDPDLEPPEARSAEQAPSPVSSDIERAGRMVERGVDLDGAEALLTAIVNERETTLKERIRAVVELSRAYEASGDKERAIAILEAELANDRLARRDLGPIRERLASLLAPEMKRSGSSPLFDPVAPFAKVLASYAPVDGNKASLHFYLSGGEQQISHRLGTFNVPGALRQSFDQDCPLCEQGLKISNHVSQGNWLLIPQAQAQFESAFLVFYFDLEENMIPARYERHLPMTVAETTAHLKAGKSFVLAKERGDGPPALLIAAPRTAMLEEVEQRLASLTHLPTEPEFFDVSTRLRPGEIRTVVRAQLHGPLRDCYESLREDQPKASGKIVVRSTVGGDGAVESVEVTANEPSLRDPSFLACVEKAASALTFPATGGELTVRYPFALRAE